MPLDQTLLQLGYLPQGVTPNVRQVEDTSPLGNVVRILKEHKVQKEQEQQKEMERQKNRLSAFITYKNAGYDSKAAMDLANGADFNKYTPGQSEADRKLKLELEKINADIARSKSEIENRNKLVNAQSNLLNKRAENIGKETGSPLLQNEKNKRIEDVISTINDSEDTRITIDNALNSVVKLESGLKGKVSYNVIKNLDANNPLLGDWQNLKMALTHAQIVASGPLKGAISDTEEKWLADAAANDNLISIPRAKSVLDKLKRAADMKEKSKVSSYKNIYKGEDPYKLEGVYSSLNNQITTSQPTQNKIGKYTYR